MDPDKDSRGYWGVIVGAAIAGITPAEASLEGHVLIGGSAIDGTAQGSGRG